MPPLTYFAARLECPRCGTISDDDTRTGMQNKLVYAQNGTTLHVGDRPDVTPGDFDSAFLLLNSPSPGAPVLVLQHWQCPTCANWNWAEVAFHGGVIESIENVALSLATLEEAHYITEWVEEDFERLTGESIYSPNGQIRVDLTSKLKQFLPATF